VHVSQQAPSLAAAFTSRFGEPALTIRASDEGVPLLGAGAELRAIVAPLAGGLAGGRGASADSASSAASARASRR
jgi:hypothetical protein